MTDLYTKTVLTVIAIALCVIAIRGPGAAIAQGSGCGDFSRNACHVTGAVEIKGEVRIDTGVQGLLVQVRR